MIFYLLVHLAILLLSFGQTTEAHYSFPGLTSLTLSNGQRPLRLDIYTLQADPTSWALYVLALQAYQADTSLSGYRQVAGIHGRPYIAWDDVFGPGGFSDPDFGYCTHSSILFCTWHRPYLALFESQINKNAVLIASKVNSSPAVNTQWKNAAQNLRVPYWDWAYNATMPTSISTPTITLRLWNGTTTIKNPLYSFSMSNFPDPGDFPDIPSAPSSGSFFPSLPKFPNQCGQAYPNTVRTPSAGCSYDSDYPTANRNLQNQGLKDQIYELLTQNLPYATFASQANGGPSLEGIHGLVHDFTGGFGTNGQGHMTSVAYSAFDPIFWLHHTNCDRLFNIYQALNPTQWFPVDGQGNSRSPTFTIDASSTTSPYDHASDPLTPFYRLTNTPYTSTSSRSTRPFGYAYPETQEWKFSSAAAFTTSVRGKVRALYGPGAGAVKLKSKGRVKKLSIKRRDGDANDAGATQTQKRYYVSIRAHRFALSRGKGFLVSLFLGTPPSDTAQWSSAMSYAGSMSVLGGGNGDGKGNMNERYVHAEIPLRGALERLGFGGVGSGGTGNRDGNGGKDGGDREVEAYLKKNLCWRIVGLDGKEVGWKGVGGLSVRVSVRDVDGEEDGEGGHGGSGKGWPSYGGERFLDDITGGKGGGWGYGGQ